MERALLTDEVRTDRAAVAALLHPDWQEVGRSGRLWTRDDVLDEIGPIEPVGFEVVSIDRIGRRHDPAALARVGRRTARRCAARCGCAPAASGRRASTRAPTSREPRPRAAWHTRPVMPARLAAGAALLGGLLWIVHALLGGGDDPLPATLHFVGLACIVLAAAVFGSTLVKSDAVAMRITVGLASGLLALALVEAFRGTDSGVVRRLLGRRGRPGRRPPSCAVRGPSRRPPPRPAAPTPADPPPGAGRESRAPPAWLHRRCPDAGGTPDRRTKETSVGERVAMISLHTSPLDQPGTGDAGGMNVYVIELAKRLGARGIDVDVFTRATSSALPQVVEAADNVLVRHVAAGPFEGLTKGELPGQLCTFAREVLRSEALQPLGHYDAVHSHYWLSGQVGALARDRWNVPLVHSMHTMAKVKNEALAAGDTPEPMSRVIGEEQVVEAADLLVANTDDRGAPARRPLRRQPGRRRGDPPGRRPHRLRAARPRRGAARSSACPRTPSC